MSSFGPFTVETNSCTKCLDKSRSLTIQNNEDKTLIASQYMLLRYYSQFDRQPKLATIRGKRFSVGSHPKNDVVVASPYVDAQAVEAVEENGRWCVRTLGLNGCEVNGQRTELGSQVDISPHNTFQIFPFVFQLAHCDQRPHLQHKRRFEEIHALVQAIHVDFLQHLHLKEHLESEVIEDIESLVAIEQTIEACAAKQKAISRFKPKLVVELAGCCVRDQMLQDLLESTEPQNGFHQKELWMEFATAMPTREQELLRWTSLCGNKLFEGVLAKQVTARIQRVESSYWQVWDDLSDRLSAPLADYLAMRQLKKQLKDILFGFGPLEDLLRIPTISEIMVNASDEIYVEKNGIIQNSGRQFVSDAVTTTVMDRIVGRVGRRLDTAQPMVDARLPDGSRVNAVIPPLAIKGPTLTIRKFSQQRFDMQQLVAWKSLSAEAAKFLEACVRSKRSLLISGGTGTGKTTLLNCLSQAIPTHERIICIEDTHELSLEHPNLVFLECRDGNNEGKGQVNIRDLLRNALRQRPDRIIVGECRGEEALDMLQAMNTGHGGSLTTVHANSGADALKRLEVLVRRSQLPPDAIRQQIVSAIDIVLQIERSHKGHRFVSSIAEVVDFDSSTGQIELRQLFEKRDWRDGERLDSTGCFPTFACELIEQGHLDLEFFLRNDVVTHFEGAEE